MRLGRWRVNAATKKRSGDNDYDGSAGDAKKAKLAKPILILLPGASGALAKDFAETVLPLLEKSFEVRLRAAGKWQVHVLGFPRHE